MADTMDQALGWDDAIEGSGSDFEPVPAGEYGFRVVSMERQYHNGSDKMAPCPVARIEIELTDAPRAAHLFDRLFLNKKTMWKIVDFFTSIGLHDKGDDKPFKPDWTRIAGRCGRCRVKTREYNGSTYNDVDRWLAPEAPAARAQAPYAPTADAMPADARTQAMINDALADAARRGQQGGMKPGAF